MKTLFGVTSSDAVTRSRLQINAALLHGMVLEHWRTGSPVHIGHDAHRPIGWVAPRGLHFEAGLARIFSNFWLAETTEESEQLKASHGAYWSSLLAKRAAPDAPLLRERVVARLADSGQALQGDEQIGYLNTTALVGKGLARRCFPDLFALADKDKSGLVPFSQLDIVLPGMYQVGSLLVFAHPFLRRSLSRMNSLNTELLNTLERLSTGADVTAKVRLDPDAVGLPEGCKSPIELQYWRGPQFNDDLSKIPTGVTQHESDERQRLFSLVCRTEFWWKRVRNDELHRHERVLEVEELRDHYTFQGDELSYGCRYVHSIVDEDSVRIEHLDGAIREYTDEALVERLDSDISKAGKKTSYTKLWRVDGDVLLSDWKTLIYHHFRDNLLIGEYLGDPHTHVDSAPPPVTQEDVLTNLVPSRLPGNTGLRVALSYRVVSADNGLPERSVIPASTLGEGDDAPFVLDMEFIELLKILKRQEANTYVPEAIAWVAHEDLYHEMPLLRHTTMRAAEETNVCLMEVLQAWKGQRDYVLALSLSLVGDGVEQILSLLGTCIDLCEWLSRHPFPPPGPEQHSHRGWVQSVSDDLNLRTAALDRPRLSDVVRPDGMFALRRVALPPEQFSPDLARGIRFDISSLEHADVVGALVEEKRLKVCPAVLIHKSVCSSCGQDFLACDCSRLHGDVAQEVVECEPLGYFWTDRPA